MRKRKVKQVSTPGSQLSPVHGSSSHVDGQLFSSQDDVQSSSSQFSSSQMDHQDAQLSHVDGHLSSSQDDVDIFHQSSSSQFSSSQMDHQDTQLSHVDNSNSQLTQASVVGSVSPASSSQRSGKSKPKCYMTKSRIKAKSVTDKNKRQQQFNKAKTDYLKGKFKSLHTCAKFDKVPYSTLYGMVLNDSQFSGSGR